MAGNITERAREIGVLKAVGWTNRNVVMQLMAESVVECVVAGILGLLIALVAAYGLSFMKVKYPHPVGDEPQASLLAGRRRSALQKPSGFPSTCHGLWRPLRFFFPS